MPKERVLITAKTYPTLSRKYGETVCTAGLREDGSWVRIYPVPFRRLNDSEQYRKFDCVEVDLVSSRSDPRPETCHLANYDQLTPVAHFGTTDGWRNRREWVLQRAQVHERLDLLIAGAHANRLSLAVFKPTRIRNFIWEDDDRDWDPAKVSQMREQTKQTELFAEETWRQTFNLIPKLPYTFSYQFEDIAGRESTLQVLDWECGQLYWNCLKSCRGDEDAALEKVREKYLGYMSGRDLFFFLGTTLQYHGWASNPWVVIGVFAPPIVEQRELALGLF
ncbi:MAG TPA: hypothetical protein PLE80_06690 [Opitutaceae bacterium]|nr:hypothetical protein [Opitutaceae bacterium]